MNTQVYGRIGQIKQYISALSDHVAANDQHGTVNIVNKFKKVVLKQDPQLHANQFLLDCLKAKNQKLLTQFQQLQQQKRTVQARLQQNKGVRKDMRQVNVGIFISRLTVTLNDVKKVQYDEVALNCNYERILLNSLIGSKYKDYPLTVEFVQNVQYKHTYAHLEYHQNQLLNILIKFQNDKDMQRWVTGLKFGMLIESSRKKERLFQVKREQPQPPPASPSTPPQPAPSTPPQHTPLVPLASFGLKQASPSQSVSVISEKKDKSMDKSLNDKMDKNTQRQLVNAMSYNSQAQLNIRSASKKSLNPQPITKKYQLNRPPNLERSPNLGRIRGLSENMDSSFELSKIYNKTNNSRKQSEDIWKPLINQAFHAQMLEKLRTQKVAEEQHRGEVKHKLGLKQEESGLDTDYRSNRIKSLESKKKELLNQVIGVSPSRSTFQFDNNKVSWAGIEEMDDQNKSKSSNKMSGRQRRDSIMTESVRGGSKDSNQPYKKQQQKSEHITEKSQQQSPRLPRVPKIHTLPSLDIPHKISYSDGTVFRLHPVAHPATNPNMPSLQQDQIKVEKSEGSKGSKQSMSSESESHQHSDPSSHQNHTESEDNNARGQELKKGIILTKYSENGFWPHQKIIYLSENENDICYRDLKDRKVKKIKISHIKSVEYKNFDKGIIKHVSKIEEDRCLVIRALVQDNKIKNFQFVSGHPQPLERFATNLTLFIEYMKKS